MRTHSKLMIRLGEDSPYRKEHPFLFQIKASAALLSNVVVGKVAHIYSGLTPNPSSGTKLEQLEEYIHRLAQTFRTYRVERNEKWTKYQVREVPKRIRTLNRLTDVTAEMAEQAFEMSCGMEQESGCWIIRAGESEKEAIEANMIFAVRQQTFAQFQK